MATIGKTERILSDRSPRHDNVTKAFHLPSRINSSRLPGGPTRIFDPESIQVSSFVRSCNLALRLTLRHLGKNFNYTFSRGLIDDWNNQEFPTISNRRGILNFSRSTPRSTREEKRRRKRNITLLFSRYREFGSIEVLEFNLDSNEISHELRIRFPAVFHGRIGKIGPYCIRPKFLASRTTLVNFSNANHGNLTFRWRRERSGPVWEAGGRRFCR